MNQLESALVIALRETINWESAVNTDLPAINPAVPFDPTAYQLRDRVLAYRDLLVGAAIVEASITVSDVYNSDVVKPNLQGLVLNNFTFSGTNAGHLDSTVRQVGYTSIPYDAARYADADLYGRDALAYEILARACAQAFVQSPVPSIDPTQSLIQNTSFWSLAEGAAQRDDINSAEALDRDLFKIPDQNLADRDNQLAGYVAQLTQALLNPFAYALRIYVQVEESGVVNREPDVYAIVSDDGVNRVFQCEPCIEGVNVIIYNVILKTLQWVRENPVDVHIPQIFALAIPGIGVGEIVRTVPQVPNPQDAQFWRGKASLLAPGGAYRQDELYYLGTTNNSSVTGGLQETDCVSLPVPGSVEIGSVSATQGQATTFNVLVKPSSQVSVSGASNNSSVVGYLGGVTFSENILSGSIGAQTYLVVGGDGIVYAGITRLPGTVFGGMAGVTTYTQAGAITSTVQQFMINWKLSLPPGLWTMRFEYADISGINDPFGVSVQYVPSGGGSVDIVSDSSPLPLSGAAGSLQWSPSYYVTIQDTNPFILQFAWTYGAGQLHIRQIVFTNSGQSTGRYSLAGSFDSRTSYAEFTGQANQTEVIRFNLAIPGTAPATVVSAFSMAAGTYADLPLQILALDVQSNGTVTAATLAASMPGWRQECLDRAERVVQQGYTQALAAFVQAGSVIPTFRDSGSFWSAEAMEAWMGFVEVNNPRLRQTGWMDSSISWANGPYTIAAGRQYEFETTGVYNGTTYGTQPWYGVAGVTAYTGIVRQVGAFVKSRPGHVGQPCLIPLGLYYDISGTGNAVATWDTPYSLPVIATCQPWMIEYGVYVAQPDFWQPDLM